MITPIDLLAKAQAAPPRTKLEDHRETIETLRDKQYTWREIAAFLNENGMETDHSKVFRFMHKSPLSFIVPSAAEYARVLPTILGARGSYKAIR